MVIHGCFRMLVSAGVLLLRALRGTFEASRKIVEKLPDMRCRHSQHKEALTADAEPT